MLNSVESEDVTDIGAAIEKCRKQPLPAGFILQAGGCPDEEQFAALSTRLGGRAEPLEIEALRNALAILDTLEANDVRGAIEPTLQPLRSGKPSPAQVEEAYDALAAQGAHVEMKDSGCARRIGLAARLLRAYQRF
jgi:hypothetical protein